MASGRLAIRGDNFTAIGAAELEAHHGQAAGVSGDEHFAEVDLAEIWNHDHVSMNFRVGVLGAVPSIF